jgi:hypothetical protein
MTRKNTHRIEMQPVLIHVTAESDMVGTPPELAADMVEWFKPGSPCLDPCAGNNVFLDLLPGNADWCEIERGRDFYKWVQPVDWIVSNPPYSHYSAWLRHSMRVAINIVYLMPVYKVFASGKFLDELFGWGGIVHIRRYGTGTQWGFTFGHALAAVHYKKDYDGDTSWSKYKAPQPPLFEGE